MEKEIAKSYSEIAKIILVVWLVSQFLTLQVMESLPAGF